MPWDGNRPPFGFSDNADTWLPMPSDWAPFTVAAQEHDPDSMLHFFRRAIELRHGRGSVGGPVEFANAPRDVVTFRGADGMTCMLNAGSVPARLPEGKLLIASAAVVDRELPADAAAWVR